MMKIRCAKCNAIVERHEICRDDANRMYRLFVNCHGDEEEMRIHDSDMQDWDTAERAQFDAILRGEIEGVAFRGIPALTSDVIMAAKPKGWGKRVEVTVLGDREDGSGIDQMNQIADRIAGKRG
jgi:hypothetical protein